MKPVNNIEYTWIDAVLSLIPNAKVFPAETYAEAEWHEEETRNKPSQSEIDTELARLIALSASLEYRDARQYPAIGDQLDDLFKAGAFSADMSAQIQAAKDANPKPI
jgi:hypothetical protein